MADKTKTPEKRSYERDTPVSLRPLDLKTALAGLLKVKPPAPPSPPETDSTRPKKSSAPEKRGKD